MMAETAKRLTFLVLVTFCFGIENKVSFGKTQGAAEEIDQSRIKEIAVMLSGTPSGPGVPITDRKTWNRLAENDSFQKVLAEAQNLLQIPIPEQNDDLFLDFSRTGNRTRWQSVGGHRRGRVRTLVLAECLENKGRFIPAFEQTVRALCDERTWVIPAHDPELTNFSGKSVDIDLGSSLLGWSLAAADYLLGEKLSPECRRMIRDNLERRIFRPYEDMICGKREKNWWMTATNNWNAVCLAGVTGSALAAIDSAQRRAIYITAAEYYSRNFLSGFTNDGYCSEGMGYWNYGFGHYVMLSEVIHQATGGNLDLLANDKARAIARFGSEIEIINGVYPAFADCSIRSRPDPRLMSFVDRRFGMGLRRWEEAGAVGGNGSLYEDLIYSFGNTASRTKSAPAAYAGPGIRSWFDEAGILVCRPLAGSASQFGVALKGGHNNEHHNHNDVGSFIAVLGDKALLLDPGSEVYTARTFNSRRYDSKVINSYGHPVPVVAGKLQRTGSEARGAVIRQEFTDAADTLTFDVSSAYDVSELKKLEREFVYSRQAGGSLTVTDRVVFSRPCDFASALVTFGNWKKVSPSSLMVYDSGRALSVEIEADGADFEIKPEIIDEDVTAGKKPTRLGINLKGPVSSATVRIVIKPAEHIGPHSGGVK